MFKRCLGPGLIALGVAILVVLQVLHLTFVNALLMAALACVVLGLVLHLWFLKRESRY
jgi:hypothetical protein